MQMQEKREDISKEMEKLQKEMDAVLRGMCRTSPPVLFLSDLKAAM